MSWQSHCGKNYVLIILLYCNGSHQGISISSSPRQAVFGNVISRFSVFGFFSLDLHICRFSKFYHHCHILKIFRVISPTLIGTLPISSLEIFLGIFLYFKSVIFCNLSSLDRSCEVHCNSSCQIINVIWVWERHKITDTSNSNEPIKHLIGGEISST